MKFFKKSYKGPLLPTNVDDLNILCKVVRMCSTKINLSKESPFNLLNLVDEEFYYILTDKLEQYPNYRIIGVSELSYDCNENDLDIKIKLNGKNFNSNLFLFGLLDNTLDSNVCKLYTESTETIQINVHFTIIISTDTIQWFLMSSCVQDENYTYANNKIYDDIINFQPSIMTINSTQKDTTCSIYKVSDNIIKNLKILASICPIKWIHKRGSGQEKNLDLIDIPTKLFYIKTKYANDFENLCYDNGLIFRRCGHPDRENINYRDYLKESSKIISYFYYLSN